MKKILTIVLLSIGLHSFAQQKPPQTINIVTPNLRCWTCKKLLEDYMAREIASNQSGIISMRINMLSGTTTVKFWPDRTSENVIRTSFNNAGFDAGIVGKDTLKATPDAYKLLPPICKRNEEGGGQKKGAKPCHVDPTY